MAGADPAYNCISVFHASKGPVTYLLVGEDQGVRNHNILPSASAVHNMLSNIAWCQRLKTSVDSIGLRLVTTKSDD